MGPRIRQVIRSTWISVGVALLVLGTLEGVTRAGIASRERLRPGRQLATIEVRPRADGSARPAWAAEYDREFEDAYQVDWRPYVYWRRRPYHGKYINVDRAGIRRTWNGTSSPSPNQLKVLMLGGSAMWGTGARDEFTIPSLVAKKLSNHVTRGVWVTNLAEVGYVSTQEVIALMLELQKGNVPDVVVFLDGVNDTFSAFQSGVAGIPQSEHHRVTEFNSRERLNFREGFVKQLALYRVSQWVVRSTGGRRSEDTFGQNFPLTESLAHRVVDAYLRNVAIVESLAGRFGFQVVFFWQPTVFSKKRQTPREQRIYERFQRRYSRAVPFFDEVYKTLKERVSAGTGGTVHDLSGIFDGETGVMFVDQIHSSEEGNDKIAEAMAQIVLKGAPGGKK